MVKKILKKNWDLQLSFKELSCAQFPGERIGQTDMSHSNTIPAAFYIIRPIFKRLWVSIFQNVWTWCSGLIPEIQINTEMKISWCSTWELLWAVVGIWGLVKQEEAEVKYHFYT